MTNGYQNYETRKKTIYIEITFSLKYNNKSLNKKVYTAYYFQLNGTC